MFKVGLYEKEITPFFGCSMSGYFNERRINGIKDKIYAKAVVIEKDGTTIAMVTVDSCGLTDDILDIARARIVELTGIDAKNITISATHTHTSLPGGIDIEEFNEIDTLYLKVLPLMIADTVACAYQRLDDATIKFTSTTIEDTIFVRNYLLKNGVVRTNPGVKNPDIVEAFGEPYKDLPILFVQDKNGKNVGLIFSLANHQDSVDGTEVSADWAGVVAKKLKEKFGNDFISIFLIGTAGNINQVNVNNDQINFFSCYEYLGQNSFDAITNALDGLKDIDGQIKVAYNEYTYSTRVPTKQELAKYQQVLDSVKIPEDCKLDASSPKEYFDACMARKAIYFAENTPKEYAVKLQVYKIADLLIFNLPGEVFSQFAFKIANAFPNNKCVFNCLANNKWSYMPPKDCYLPELYESLYGSSRFYPEDVEDIMDKAIELGKSLL